MRTNVKYFIITYLLLLSFELFAQELTLLESNYKLDSGDEISIAIFGEDDMSLVTKLDDSGIINYPYFDEPIKVKGMTIKQLKDYLLNGLKPDVFINPSMQITVTEYRPFFINGQVNSPGGYPFQPGLNVSKAITLAGGMTERASESSIYVIRATDTTETKLKVRMNDKIFPGDILTIEESFF